MGEGSRVRQVLEKITYIDHRWRMVPQSMKSYSYLSVVIGVCCFFHAVLCLLLEDTMNARFIKLGMMTWVVPWYKLNGPIIILLIVSAGFIVKNILLWRGVQSALVWNWILGALWCAMWMYVFSKFNDWPMRLLPLLYCAPQWYWLVIIRRHWFTEQQSLS